MNLVIKIYITVCVLLLVFDVVFLIIKNIKTGEVYRMNASFENRIREEVARRRDTGTFSVDFAEELRKKLGKIKNMVTLQNTVGDDPEVWEWFRGPVLSQLDHYRKKSDYEQAYYTYLISTFDYGKEKNPPAFNAAFLDFLDSRSLYIFANSMMALYESGETDLLIEAVDKINERGAFYHKKLFVDGLLDSKADFDALNPRLEARFDRYTPYVQDCLLDFFRLSGYGGAVELCLRLMEDPQTDKQVQYTAMRYFAKYPDERAKRIFLEILNEGEELWVHQVLAIQALGRYNDVEVWQAVGKKIRSTNWFMRINAVDYMHKVGLNREQVFDILYMRDRYANEALLYQYRDDKKMSRYIMDIMHMLNLQAEMGGESTDDIHAVAAIME